MLLTTEFDQAQDYWSDPHNLAGQIGNTPLLRLEKTAEAYGLPLPVSLEAKAEWFNPGGSVKDRAALYIIRSAEENGLLRPGMTILESTSGNTGIALAMLGAARGYGVKLAVPENVSVERLAILRALGAEVILTDPLQGSDGAFLLAKELARKDLSLFYANQYNNNANWQSHYFGTAEEIWKQTEGQITHFIAGLGTGGTFTGVTRRLRELNDTVLCYSAEPDSPFHGLEGWKHMETAIRPGIYDEKLADGNLSVRTEDAFEMARFLAREEGLFAGISAAAAIVASITVARQLERGRVVTILPDGGGKYLSQPFWNKPADQ